MENHLICNKFQLMSTIFKPKQNPNIKLSCNLPDSRSFLYADEYFYGLAGVTQRLFNMGDRINRIPHGLEQFVSFCSRKPNLPKVLAICDSWGHYPGLGGDGDWLQGGDGNLLDNMRDRQTLAIYRVGLNGAEAKDLFQEKHTAFFERILDQGDFDLVFISLGGNDLASENVPKYLGTKGIEQDKLNALCDEIFTQFSWFLKLLSKYGIPALGHSYDDATWCDGGTNMEIGFGGIDLSQLHISKNWIVRYLAEKGIIKKKEQARIVREVLQSLKTRVFDKLINTEEFKFSYVDTYDCLANYAEGKLPFIPGIPLKEKDKTPRRFWLNEIHPTRDGFRILENYIYEAIAEILNLPNIGSIIEGTTK